MLHLNIKHVRLSNPEWHLDRVSEKEANQAGSDTAVWLCACSFPLWACFFCAWASYVRVMLIRWNEFSASIECPKVPTHVVSFPKGATQDSSWEDKDEWGALEALSFL